MTTHVLMGQDEVGQIYSACQFEFSPFSEFNPFLDFSPFSKLRPNLEFSTY
jgi:hypothetical protein